MQLLRFKMRLNNNDKNVMLITLLIKSKNSIFQIACMTSHRYFHFAQHAYLKSTCLLIDNFDTSPH